MNTIDILIAVDGTTLAGEVADGSLSAGTQDSPTSLGSYSTSDVYISLITQSGNVDNNTQGDSELQVKANSGDILNGSITTFSDNTDYTAYLYDGTFNPSGAIDPLTYSNSQEYNYLPPSGDATADPDQYTNTFYTAYAKVDNVGVSIQYTLSFTLVDNSSGKIIGYFKWDPFINMN